MTRAHNEANAPFGRTNFDFFEAFRVRYAEIDAQGVMFNAHYLTWFDTATFAFFRSTGFVTKDVFNRFHLVQSLVNYRAPLHFDAEVDVGVRFGRLGNSSLALDFAMFPKGNDALLTTGEAVMVYMDLQLPEPAPLPQEMRDRISEYSA